MAASINPAHLQAGEAERQAVEHMIHGNKECRVIRVFVSSTFKDCHGERDILQRITVPRLQAWCIRLRPEPLIFNCLDLRWGVTQQQSQSGAVLQICLEEIDRCRPFFIGIMTNRYGWHNTYILRGKVGHEDTSDILYRETMEIAMQPFPWIESYDDRSATELEIRHGALRHADIMRHRAFFYYREKDFDHTAEEETRNAKERLQLLKEEIKQEGFPVRCYKTLTEFAGYVEEDLKGLIQEDFPKSQTATKRTGEVDRSENDASDSYDENYAEEDGSELEEEEVDEDEEEEEEYINADFASLEQDYFLQELLCGQRIRHFVHSGGTIPKLEDYISEEAKDDGHQPIVVAADPGMGKSCLLSYLAKKAKNDGNTVCLYFCGLGSSSLKKNTIMASLLHQAIRLGLDLLPITQDTNCAAIFSKVLQGKVSMKVDQQVVDGQQDRRRLIFIIDALNMIEGDGSSQQMTSFSWLPTSIAKHVRLIVSTRKGNMSRQLQEMGGWNIVEVDAMDLAAKTNLIQLTLREVGKCLDREKLRRVTNAYQTSNPLFLSSLLKELCSCATFDSLDDILSKYLQATTVGQLFNQILERWEVDYESNIITKDGKPRQNLVRDIMLSICLSRRGMSEAELQRVWHITSVQMSPILAAAGDSLFTTSSGCLVITHADLKEACLKRYLGDQENGQKNPCELLIMEHLADYFVNEGKDLVRQADELPYILKTLKDDNRLLAYLSQLSTLRTFVDTFRKFPLLQHWREVSNYEVAGAAYAAAIKATYGETHEPGSMKSGKLGGNSFDPCSYAINLYKVAMFLTDTGQYEEALPLHKRHLLAMVDRAGDCHPMSVKALLETADCTYNYGVGRSDVDYRNAIAFCRRAFKGVQVCATESQFRLEEEAKEVEARILDRLGHLLFCVAKSMENGKRKSTMLSDAEESLDQAVDLWVTSTSSRSRIESRGTLIQVYKEQNHLDKALDLAKTTLEDSKREFGDNEFETSKIQGVLADVLAELDRPQEAISQYQRAYSTHKDLIGSDHVDTERILHRLNTLTTLVRRRESDETSKTPTYQQERMERPAQDAQSVSSRRESIAQDVESANPDHQSTASKRKTPGGVRFAGIGNDSEQEVSILDQMIRTQALGPSRPNPQIYDRDEFKKRLETRPFSLKIAERKNEEVGGQCSTADSVGLVVKHAPPSPQHSMATATCKRHNQSTSQSSGKVAIAEKYFKSQQDKGDNSSRVHRYFHTVTW